MKKLFLFIISLLLFGCVDNHVIEVVHTDQGYTSELVGTIKSNEGDFVYVNTYKEDYILASRRNADGSIQQFHVNFNENTVEEIEVKEEENKPFILAGTDDFNILYKSDHEITEDGKSTIWIKDYYYEKDGNINLLYHYEEETNSKVKYFEIHEVPSTQNYQFYIEDENRDEIVIYDVKEGKLVESDAIPLNDENYTFKDVMYYNDKFAYQYENDEKIRLVTNQKEIFFDKKMDDYELISFNVLENKFISTYENKTSIRYIVDNDEQIIEKEVDGYTLKEYYLYDEQQFYYEKDGYLRLVLDDQTYDLGYQPNYRIKEDYILSSSREKDKNEKQTIYIDRKSNETYVLSEYIDMYDLNNFYDLYLNRIYKGIDVQYQIIQVKDKTVTIIDLPFSKDFDYERYLDEKRLIYTHQTDDEMSFYLVTVEE